MGQKISKELVVALGVPLLLGQVVGAVQGRDSFTWFKLLKKPAWCPPPPVFPIVWTTLYALMGYASYIVYQYGGFEAQKPVLLLYGFQLVLNLLWPIIFFKLQKLKTAQAENLVLLAAAGATAKRFYEVDPLAGKLLIPYIAWLVLANALNLYIANKNLSADQDPRLQDLYHPADKRNPGEKGAGPATASLSTHVSHSARNRGRLQVVGGGLRPQAKPAPKASQQAGSLKRTFPAQMASIGPRARLFAV